MIWRLFIWYFSLSVSSLSAMLVGNPAEPILMKKGIWRGSSWVSFRLGYLDDWVYQQRFQDEFKQLDDSHTRTYLKLSTYSGMVTLNFLNRLDLYGVVGSSRMQIDEEIFTKRALSWAGGAKLLFLKRGDLFFGADVKYFETAQKPSYVIIEGQAYNIVGTYKLRLQEIQGAVGVSYRAWKLAPYINATYIRTHIEPEPDIGLIRFPDSNDIADLPLKPIVCKKLWGMALGLSLIDSAIATLAFEWRAFNQNAINLNGEIRF